MAGVGILGAIGGTALGIGTALIQHRLNEQSANKADQRTRQLYHDLYSPAAQAEQIRRAGLSLGLMYAKGGLGGSGQSGAQAAGTSVNPVNIDIMGTMLGLSQKKNIDADTAKKEAEKNEIISRTKETDQRILNLLEENKLTIAKTAYQNLVNLLTNYDIKFKDETIETDIEQRKVELAKMVEDYRTAYNNAERSGIQLEIENSTAAAKIKQEMQKVILNDLEAQIKRSNLQINAAQLEKIQTEIIEKRLTNAWIDIKNEEDINKLRHDIQMDLYDMDIKDRQQNYNIAKGIMDSFLSVAKIAIKGQVLSTIK